MTSTQLLGSQTGTGLPQAAAPAAFGKYRVEALLGAGGFGAVYRCHDESLGRDVAVKAMTPAMLDNPGLRERFLREARALARVSHPCIVQVHDVGESEHGPFFVMELVGGRDLAVLLREAGTLPEARAVALCRSVATGLQAAAAVGVVHRDVKPANILVAGNPPAETVKVTDFGLAFPTSAESTRLTEPTTILGTPDYMAPEQARGSTVDFRADMYALGCTLFELLTGQPPFARETAHATVLAHLTEAPTPPRSLHGAVTVPVNNLVLRLLAKEPSARFASYDDLLAAMDAATPLSSGALRSGSLPSPLAPPPSAASRVGSGSLDAPVRTENLALCFVDLLDFAERTREQSREQNARWVGRYAEGMKRLVENHGGRFIKQVYGAVLCAFESPTDAVVFGMASVDAAWAWSRGRPAAETYQVRVGINMGEVRVDQGDVYGDPVNIAARTEAAATPGQVLFTEAVHLSMNRTEVTAACVGAREFKGVPVPVKVYAALPGKEVVPGPNVAPFGGKHLVRRVDEGALETLDKGARAVVGSVGVVGRAVGGAWNGLRALAAPVLPPLARLWSRVPARHRRKVAVGVPTLVFVVAAALLLPGWLDPLRAEIALMEQGKAAAAVKTLEVHAVNSPRAQWLLAKALVMTGKPVPGMEELDKALARDPELATPQALDLVVSAMEVKNKAVQRVLVKRFGGRARDTLKGLITSERYHVRHQAYDALQELDMADTRDAVDLAVKDVRVEHECARRRDGLKALEANATQEALDAVERLRLEPAGTNECVVDLLESVSKKLRRKLVK